MGDLAVAGGQAPPAGSPAAGGDRFRAEVEVRGERSGPPGGLAGGRRRGVPARTGVPGKDERRLSLWWINRSEWEGLIDVAGLEVEALYGGFERQPFDKDSREFVWVTRKPA